jgi:formylglycine-generating enzyme required for sulfatase activity
MAVLLAGVAALASCDTHSALVTGVNASPSSTPVGTVFADPLRSGGSAPSMVVVPGGRFRVGEGSDQWRATRWLTGFTAVIPRPLAVARTETTVASFRQFVERTAAHIDKGCQYHTVQQEWKVASNASWSSPVFAQTENHPVTCVTYEDAQAYVRWLSAETHHTYRLPTEDELEYFNRGRRSGAYSFPFNGVADLCTMTNGADKSAQFAYAYGCSDGFEFTAPVGSFPPNGFGLYDTTGNLWELTTDCWQSDYARAFWHLLGYGSQPSDGSGRRCDSRHVVRGGSYISSPGNLKIAKREIESLRSHRTGFRVVRELR